MAKNNSEDIDFQHYIDAVKQKNIAWNIFIDLMQDLSYRNMNRLRILNAILLTELTTNYSDMDKSKYLNILLLTEFKNHIQREHKVEATTNEDSEKSEESKVDLLLVEESSKEILTGSGIQLPIANERKSDLNSSFLKKDII